MQDLFQYIGRYKPHNIELDTKLKCFVPDYIPSVGEIDAFLKIPRPDGDNDNLGLKLLDEPAATQSDPTVLDLQMRATAKKVAMCAIHLLLPLAGLLTLILSSLAFPASPTWSLLTSIRLTMQTRILG